MPIFFSLLERVGVCSIRKVVKLFEEREKSIFNGILLPHRGGDEKSSEK
jgi:hypothetical protein